MGESSNQIAKNISSDQVQRESVILVKGQV